MAKALLQIAWQPLPVIEQNAYTHHTAHKKSSASLSWLTFPVLSAQSCLIHPQPIHSLTSLFVILFKHKFLCFPLFCSLLPPTLGQMLPGMNYKVMSHPTADASVPWVSARKCLWMQRILSSMHFFLGTIIPCGMRKRSCQGLSLHLPQPRTQERRKLLFRSNSSLYWLPDSYPHWKREGAHTFYQENVQQLFMFVFFFFNMFFRPYGRSSECFSLCWHYTHKKTSSHSVFYTNSPIFFCIT